MKRKHDQTFPPASEISTHAGQLSRRALLTALPATVALSSVSGCIGSFAVTNKLLDWNRGLGNKWVNWLVFVLLFIIPVYPIIFGLVDLWVFNTIEFWSGESVVASKDTPDGGRVLTERTADPKTARLRHISAQGELLAELYIRRESDEHFELLDREGRVLASVSGREHITMRDAEGRKISALNPRQMRRIKVAIEQGASPAEQAWEAMETKDESMRMLAMSETIRERVIF